MTTIMFHYPLPLKKTHKASDRREPLRTNKRPAGHGRPATPKSPGVAVLAWVWMVGNLINLGYVIYDIN